jgi:hypothetical protein
MADPASSILAPQVAPVARPVATAAQDAARRVANNMPHHDTAAQAANARLPHLNGGLLPPQMAVPPAGALPQPLPASWNSPF